MVSLGAGSGLTLLGLGIVAWALAAFVAFSAPREPKNHALVAFLAVRGAYQIVFGSVSITNWGLAWVGDAWLLRLVQLAVVLDALSAVLFLWLVGHLVRGRVTRWIHRPAARGVVAAVFVAFVAVWLMAPAALMGRQWGFGYYLTGFASAVGLVQSIRILRRARDDGSRLRGRAFLFAFGAYGGYALLLAVQALGEDLAGVVLPLGPAAWYTAWNYDLWLEVAIGALFLCTLTYSALTGQLVQMDRRIQRAIQRSVVMLLVAAVFLVLTEGLEGVLGFESALLSLLAAGVITVVFQPIQSGAEQLATKLVPGATMAHRLPKRERMKLYEEQVRLAWDDGRLQQKERTMLDRLRATLELADDACEEIEARHSP